MAKGAGSLWTIERCQKARSLYEDGWSLALVAAELDSNTGRVAQAIRMAGGTIRSRAWDAERRVEALALYEGGATLDEVAKALQSNDRRVAEAIRQAGGTIRGTGAPLQRNSHWKGGRHVDKDGYVLLKRPDHPDADCHGYIREHRLVMEQKIGRRLLPEEVPHHLNDDHADNRPDNLELYPSNGSHLSRTLAGRCPKWSVAGKAAQNAAREARIQKTRMPRQVPDGPLSPATAGRIVRRVEAVAPVLCVPEDRRQQ